jgi:hypothetical protein
MLAHEVIQGVLCLVQYIRYRNGRTVKRVIDTATGIPTDVIPVN